MPRKRRKTASESLAVVKKSDFIPPPDVRDGDAGMEPLPVQEEFWRPPVRFGSIPVESEPLGWDRRAYRKLFPFVSLPIQVVERISFGHPHLEPNRLFWGDNLHVMRQLPPESIDLIYVDPPFFSGRQYNVIFGDQNELRSFSDIWDGGMPGYLIWLNARLYEMKRLLKKTGSIYVHCDWHASHYIKVEMDKIFGYENSRNEVIWWYENKLPTGGDLLDRQHDVLLWYSRGGNWKYKPIKIPIEIKQPQARTRKVGGKRQYIRDYEGNIVYEQREEKLAADVWRIPLIHPIGRERVGYPTQKPIALVQRCIEACTEPGDVVADFFCGGGTAPVVAQQLGRRWIACDQSRVAVAITTDRITRLVEEEIGKVFPVADFTIEHWGVYEAERLSKMPTDQFRAFVLRAFAAVPETSQQGIHGTKGAVPVWVGVPDQRSQVTANEVADFANAIRRTIRYKQDNLRDGFMLAWAFRPDAVLAAERLRELERTDVNFVRLEQIRIDSPRFREHVTVLSTDHADYANFLTFVQPPKVIVGWKRLASRTYKFDVSETVVLNPGAKIINVQWDFDYDKRFSSTPGHSFVRSAKGEPMLQTQYEFPRTGIFRIACKVQDDLGGEGLWRGEIEVN